MLGLDLMMFFAIPNDEVCIGQSKSRGNEGFIGKCRIRSHCESGRISRGIAIFPRP